MKIRVKRFEYGTNYTVGRMYIDDAFQCFVLEDRCREKPGVAVAEWKVPGETAIPSGTYKVDIDMSARFGRPMPHILNVPGFDGIRIHSGNTDKDTEGCLLVGNGWAGTDFVSNSRAAFDTFFPKLRSAILNGEEVILEIGG